MQMLLKRALPKKCASLCGGAVRGLACTLLLQKTVPVKCGIESKASV